MSAVIDIVAARLRHERTYESGRMQGWLEARRYYLLHRGHERNWGDMLFGGVVGGCAAALVVMVVHRL